MHCLIPFFTLHYFLIKKYMYIKQAWGGNSESAVVFLLWLHSSFSVNLKTTCTKSHYYAAAVFFMHFTAERGCETLVTGSGFSLPWHQLRINSVWLRWIVTHEQCWALNVTVENNWSKLIHSPLHVTIYWISLVIKFVMTEHYRFLNSPLIKWPRWFISMWFCMVHVTRSTYRKHNTERACKLLTDSQSQMVSHQGLSLPHDDHILSTVFTL